jgi:hypothetical protein
VAGAHVLQIWDADQAWLGLIPRSSWAHVNPPTAPREVSGPVGAVHHLGSRECPERSFGKVVTACPLLPAVGPSTRGHAQTPLSHAPLSHTPPNDPHHKKRCRIDRLCRRQGSRVWEAPPGWPRRRCPQPLECAAARRHGTVMTWRGSVPIVVAPFRRTPETHGPDGPDRAGARAAGPRPPSWAVRTAGPRAAPARPGPGAAFTGLPWDKVVSGWGQAVFSGAWGSSGASLSHIRLHQPSGTAVDDDGRPMSAGQWDKVVSGWGQAGFSGAWGSSGASLSHKRLHQSSDVDAGLPVRSSPCRPPQHPASRAGSLVPAVQWDKVVSG